MVVLGRTMPVCQQAPTIAGSAAQDLTTTYDLAFQLVRDAATALHTDDMDASMRTILRP